MRSGRLSNLIPLAHHAHHAHHALHALLVHHAQNHVFLATNLALVINIAGLATLNALVKPKVS